MVIVGIIVTIILLIAVIAIVLILIRSNDENLLASVRITLSYRELKHDPNVSPESLYNEKLKALTKFSDQEMERFRNNFFPDPEFDVLVVYRPKDMDLILRFYRSFPHLRIFVIEPDSKRLEEVLKYTYQTTIRVFQLVLHPDFDLCYKTGDHSKCKYPTKTKSVWLHDFMKKLKILSLECLYTDDLDFLNHLQSHPVFGVKHIALRRPLLTNIGPNLKQLESIYGTIESI